MKSIIVLLILILFSCCNDERNDRVSAVKATLSDMELKGGTLIPGGYSINASNVENATQVLHPVYTTIERMSFSVSFTVNSKNVILRIGKGFCFAEILGSQMSVYQISDDFNGSSLIDIINLPFCLVENTKYNISIDKLDGYRLKYSIVSVDSQFDKIYNIDTGSGFNAIRAWGQAFFGVKDGNVLVNDAIITTGYDRETVVSFWGDSFFDAANLVGNGGTFKDRYCDLVAQEIGYEKVPIMARTGHALDASFLDRFKIENSYFKSPYVFIAMGTNNRSLDEYITYVKECIKEVKRNNQTPILVTVTPRPDVDYSLVTKPINEWVRASGERYVDINRAVADDNGNWNPLYVVADSIHPSVEGEHAMFRRIKIDVPELFY